MVSHWPRLVGFGWVLRKNRGFGFFDHHQNQLRTFSDNAHARPLLNANYMDGRSTTHCWRGEREGERGSRYDRPMGLWCPVPTND